MVIDFKSGKIIANQFEVVIRITGVHMLALQAQVDAIQLIGGANVVSANGAECKWSVKLDNERQLQALSSEIGVDIQ